MAYKALVDQLKQSGEAVSLGTEAQAPDPALIAEAERKLGRELPASYLWFLQSYGGGTVFGDEVFSLYATSAIRPSGDVVLNSLDYADQGWIGPGEIAVCSTDYGEIFAIGTEKEGEDYPVNRYSGGEKSRFASSFAGFLLKLLTT